MHAPSAQTLLPQPTAATPVLIAAPLPAFGPERERCEEELLRRGIALPLFHRAAAAHTPPGSESLLLGLRDDNGWAATVAVRLRPARGVPGHELLFADRFGATLRAELVAPATAALVRWARARPRALQLRVRAFARDPEHLQRLVRALAAAGLHRADETSNYARTLALDLAPTEEQLFAAIHRSARRNVRQVERMPTVELAPVDDPALSGRLEQLMRETLERTGGRHQPQDWPGRIALSRARPDLSRLVGLFDRERTGPEALLAFAWGCRHGDQVEYADAAATRDLAARIPCAYPLMWDLIVWARRGGARWFDFGGVTGSAEADDAGDPLAGISTFKRYFAGDEVEVAQDWILLPSARARLADAVRRWRG